MHILRTRLKKDIVCEFLPPSRPSRKVIILCPGMPSTPKDKQTLEFWSQKGFWVFFPRYRGTWESDGEFLKESPEKDILDIIDELYSRREVTDFWSGLPYKLPAKSYKLFLFGGSFGGPSAILCSRDQRVTKAITFAPVIDWQAPSPDEPMNKLGRYISQAFGNGYRFSQKNWKRLSENKFYSPVTEADTVDGNKLLIFHAKDDGSCDYNATKKFARVTGAKLVTLRSGGHFGLSRSTEPAFYKHIKKFLSY